MITGAIREMLAKGMSIEDALAIVEQFEVPAPVDDRSSNAKRQARYRERKRNANRNETVTSVTPLADITPVTDVTPNRNETVTNRNAPTLRARAHVEDSSANEVDTGKKEGKNNKGNGRNGVTPRSILLEGLSSEDADAVIAHRRRCPMTPRAARLLLTEFMSTGDPHAAVDMMILRGWRGFKRAWFDNERTGNGQGRQGNGNGRGSLVAAGKRLTEYLDHECELRAHDSQPLRDAAFQLLPIIRGK
jgi:hypothetical protein